MTLKVSRTKVIYLLLKKCVKSGTTKIPQASFIGLVPPYRHVDVTLSSYNDRGVVKDGVDLGGIL